MSAKRELQKELKRNWPGWTIEGINGRGHFVISRPGFQSQTASASPSCPFWLKHVGGDLRREERRVAAAAQAKAASRAA
jgi:hypothetical protein